MNTNTESGEFHPVIELLLNLAYHAWSVADDAEDNGDSVTVLRSDMDALSCVLDKLDELPDDQPGYTMGPAAKARWALRHLAAREPAGSEPVAYRVRCFDAVTGKEMPKAGWVDGAPPEFVYDFAKKHGDAYQIETAYATQPHEPVGIIHDCDGTFEIELSESAHDTDAGALDGRPVYLDQPHEPKVDLGQFRVSVEKAHKLANNRWVSGWMKDEEYKEATAERDRLLALIDSQQ